MAGRQSVSQSKDRIHLANGAKRTEHGLTVVSRITNLVLSNIRQLPKAGTGVGQARSFQDECAFLYDVENG